MAVFARLELITFTLTAVVITYTQGLKIDLSRLARLAANRPMSKRMSGQCMGNPCKASEPFLCRTSSKCVPLKYVCDGTWDCEDGFDEMPEVCNAGVRPDMNQLIEFLETQRDWMIPQLFNGANPETVAHALTVASDIEDLSSSVGMLPENVDRLRTAFDAAQEGDERPLLRMGMEERSWHEVQYVLQKLLDSGFHY